MTPFTPFCDASVTGAIAASLSMRAPIVPAAVFSDEPFVPTQASAQAERRRRGWFAAAFDLISGPSAPPRSDASNT